MNALTNHTGGDGEIGAGYHLYSFNESSPTGLNQHELFPPIIPEMTSSATTPMSLPPFSAFGISLYDIDEAPLIQFFPSGGVNPIQNNVSEFTAPSLVSVARIEHARPALHEDSPHVSGNATPIQVCPYARSSNR